MTKMDAMSWIALGALAFTVLSALYGTIAAGFHRLGAKIDNLSATGERRHNDNLEKFGAQDERLGRIETSLSFIIRNGSNGAH